MTELLKKIVNAVNSKTQNIAIVSAHTLPKKDEDKQEHDELNKQEHQKLLSDIKQMEYPYIPLFGHWIYEETNESIKEESLFVFGDNVSTNTFKSQMLMLCNKYNQESIVIKTEFKRILILKGDNTIDMVFDTIVPNKRGEVYSTIQETGEDFIFTNSSDTDSSDVEDDSSLTESVVVQYYKRLAGLSK